MVKVVVAVVVFVGVRKGSRCGSVMVSTGEGRARNITAI